MPVMPGSMDFGNHPVKSPNNTSVKQFTDGPLKGTYELNGTQVANPEWTPPPDAVVKRVSMYNERQTAPHASPSPNDPNHRLTGSNSYSNKSKAPLR